MTISPRTLVDEYHIAAQKRNLIERCVPKANIVIFCEKNMASHLLSFDNPVFSNYAFYAGIAVAKMFAMGFVTGYWGQREQVT